MDPAATRCPSCGQGLAVDADLDSILGRIDSPDATIPASALRISIPPRLKGAKVVPPPGVRARRKSVLIIDDDGDARAAAVSALADAQVPVREAADGKQGLALLGTLTPDLVVVEPEMGGSISGADVLERLKARAEFAAMPTILYSNASFESTAKRHASALVRKREGPGVLVGHVIRIFREQS